MVVPVINTEKAETVRDVSSNIKRITLKGSYKFRWGLVFTIPPRDNWCPWKMFNILRVLRQL